MSFKVSPDWWDSRTRGSFFHSVYFHGDDSLEGHVADEEFDLAARTGRECKAILQLLRPLRGRKFLDCPCGQGRHAIALAECDRRYEVVGVDVSQAAIERAAGEAARRQMTNVKFARGDMREIPAIKNSVHYVINMFFSFGFFDADEDNLQVLREYARVLQPQGQLLIHTDVNPSKIARGSYGDRTCRTLRDGSELEIHERYNKSTQRLDGIWTIRGPEEQVREAGYSVRIYSNHELLEMLRSVGFKDVDIFAFPPSSCAPDDAQEIAYVAYRE